MTVDLSDGRRIVVPLARYPWLAWLLAASEAERAGWTIEPGGYAVYWPKLDDGVEVCHLLSSSALDPDSAVTL